MFIVNKMQRAHSIVVPWNTLFNLYKMNEIKKYNFSNNIIRKVIFERKYSRNRFINTSKADQFAVI